VKSYVCCGVETRTWAPDVVGSRCPVSVCCVSVGWHLDAALSVSWKSTLRIQIRVFLVEWDCWLVFGVEWAVGCPLLERKSATKRRGVDACLASHPGIGRGCGGRKGKKREQMHIGPSVAGIEGEIPRNSLPVSLLEGKRLAHDSLLNESGTFGLRPELGLDS
jgi:hypothetical protein